MKLKNVSCTQFAGVCDRNIDLEDGINVIYGRNESGKSTLVNLISRTIFQKAKLDGRKDKSFKDSYFPSTKKGSSWQGDFADGSVTFETDEGRYILEKEWGSDSHVTLCTPDGERIHGTQKIDEILRKILVYGEGVYSEMLLLAQNNMEETLKTLLDTPEKFDAKKEIVDVATKAFAESDGISMDAVETAIKAKIDALVGKHWDEERSAPAYKATGRWKKEVGEILDAYYEQKDAEEDRDNIKKLFDAMEAANNNYAEKEKQLKEQERKSEEFKDFADLLNKKQEMKKLETDRNRYRDALDRWPEADKEYRNAKKLMDERKNREVLDQYEKAKKVHEELDKVDQTLVQRQCPTQEEIDTVRKDEGDITRLENQLRGMNLNTVIHMLDGHSVEITTVRDGKNLPLNGEQAAITEAVKIRIPGVMEMELTPANVNVSTVKNKVAEAQKSRSTVLKQYEVETLDELQKLKDDIEEAKKQEKNCQEDLNRILDGADFETLKAKTAKIPAEIRSAEEIQSAIDKLCGGNSLDVFYGRVGNEIETFQGTYNNQNDLSTMLEQANKDLKELEKNITSLDDIPAEFRDVTDPESYQKMLDESIKIAKNDVEPALEDKTNAKNNLKRSQDTIAGDPEERLSQAKYKLDEKQEELRHWRHIQQVIKAQKEKIHDNPMEDISKNFAHYLEIISDGRVASEFPHEDKLEMNIYSNNFHLNYGKLSEGTKETVALAFRLAVLDHLFPKGGGLAVFDDPFTDMDLERIHQSCNLLKDCAQRHQVIVLTCREEYIPLLGGHIIRI